MGMMNAAVLNVYDILSSWVNSFLVKANRTVHIIGYSRAAAELARQGLYQEAKRCMLELENHK